MTTTTTTTDARVRVYYKLTLWAWRLRWANKMACVHSEDSDQPGDQPGHPPSLIRVFTVRMKKAWFFTYPLSAQQRLWSDWADAQADLSLCWANTLFVGFVMRQLKWCSCHTESDLAFLSLPAMNLGAAFQQNFHLAEPCWCMVMTDMFARYVLSASKYFLLTFKPSWYHDRTLTSVFTFTWNQITLIKILKPICIKWI